MKYLAATLFSVVIFLIWIGREEGRMPWLGPMGRHQKSWVDREWNDGEKRAHRKKVYRIVLFVWSIVTVVAFAYVTLYWD